MIYPAYVHLGDAYHAHGVTIPDFPGCFSAADAWDLYPMPSRKRLNYIAKVKTWTYPHQAL